MTGGRDDRRRTTDDGRPTTDDRRRMTDDRLSSVASLSRRSLQIGRRSTVVSVLGRRSSVVFIGRRSLL